MKKLDFIILITFFAFHFCGNKYIENTKIRNTEENRIIYNLIMKYRQAIEERDVSTLVSLVSRKYYEDASTTSDDSDDYGYEELLKKVIPIIRDNIKNVQYVIFLKNIEVQKNRAFAEFEYYCKFHFVESGKEQWVAKSDFNRLEFIKEDGVWKISGGL